jgi:hypothetical protein
MARPVEILTMDELAEAAIQLQYMNVVCIDDDWYERYDVLREIDRRVMLGKVARS